MQTITNMAMIELLLTMCLISWTLLTLWKIGQNAQSLKTQIILKDHYIFNKDNEQTNLALDRMGEELTVRLNKLSENTIVHWEKELSEKEAQLVLREAALLEKCDTATTDTNIPLSSL